MKYMKYMSVAVFFLLAVLCEFLGLTSTPSFAGDLPLRETAAAAATAVPDLRDRMVPLVQGLVRRLAPDYVSAADDQQAQNEAQKVIREETPALSSPEAQMAIALLVDRLVELRNPLTAESAIIASATGDFESRRKASVGFYLTLMQSIAAKDKTGRILVNSSDARTLHTVFGLLPTWGALASFLYIAIYHNEYYGIPVVLGLLPAIFYSLHVTSASPEKITSDATAFQEAMQTIQKAGFVTSGEAHQNFEAGDIRKLQALICDQALESPPSFVRIAAEAAESQQDVDAAASPGAQRQGSGR